MAKQEPVTEKSSAVPSELEVRESKDSRERAQADVAVPDPEDESEGLVLVLANVKGE